MGTGQKAYYGDIHNHCGISYGHGSLDDAIKNAGQKLDFCSVTGHAHWCDMPEPNERIAHIIDFHKVGFSKLKMNWPDIIKELQGYNKPGEFLVFPGFEMHSCQDGDITIVYFEKDGSILYPDTVGEMQSRILEMQNNGIKIIAFPHHVAYHQGARGINWKSFNRSVSPVVEVYSMHGGSENTETTFPYRHSMGPADWESTVQYGLEQGNVFGFIANTDHHSAHPASYGQGYTGVWADELSNEAVFQAITNRRTFALTGDKISVDYELEDTLMGGIRPAGPFRGLKASITAGGEIDCVDVCLNSRLVKRISQYDMNTAAGEPGGSIRSLVFLEVGWGQRGKRQEWDVDFGVTEGTIVDIETRFRGPDILSPEQKDLPSKESSSFYSSCEKRGEQSVHFNTVTYGNPTNTTPGTQGVCLTVDMPKGAKIWTRINGLYKETTAEDLLKGGRSGYLIDEIDAPSWLLHKMPRQEQFQWEIDLPNFEGELKPGGFLYLNVRQKNGQYAWASPVFAE